MGYNMDAVQNNTVLDDTDSSFTEISTLTEAHTQKVRADDIEASDPIIPYTTSVSLVPWRQKSPVAALLTPIPPPLQLEPLPPAALPRPRPPVENGDGDRDNGKQTQAAKVRPLAFDALVHAMFRVTEAATHAVFATERVCAWATTPEPPYTLMDDMQVRELRAIVPVTLATVRIARRVLLIGVAPVAQRGPLWNPWASQYVDEMPSLGQDGDDWWEAGEDMEAMFDGVDAAARALQERATDRSGRWRTPQKAGAWLSFARIEAKAAKINADEYRAGRCSHTSVFPSQEAVLCAAEAVALLTTVARKTAGAASRNRFWQWGAWVQSVRRRSCADGTMLSVGAVSYKIARQEAENALAQAVAASTQAVAAAKAAGEYYY